ncbi:hypothetical protein D3C81_1636810 [compost metagenome]
MQADMVGDALEISGVGDALDRGMVDAVVHQHGLEWCAGTDRLPDDHLFPGHRQAVLSQANSRLV